MSHSAELILLQNDALSKTSSCLSTLSLINCHETSTVDTLTSQLVEIVSILSKSFRLVHKVSSREEAHVATILELKDLVQRQKTALEMYRKPIMVDGDSQTDKDTIDCTLPEKVSVSREVELLEAIERLTKQKKSMDESCKILKTKNRKLRRIIWHEHCVIEAQQKLADSMASSKCRVRHLNLPTSHQPLDDTYEISEFKSMDNQEYGGQGAFANFEDRFDSLNRRDEILRTVEDTTDCQSPSVSFHGHDNEFLIPSRSARSWHEIEQSEGAISADASAHGVSVKLTVPVHVKPSDEHGDHATNECGYRDTTTTSCQSRSEIAEFEHKREYNRGEGVVVSFSGRSESSLSMQYGCEVQQSQIAKNESQSIDENASVSLDTSHCINIDGDDLRDSASVTAASVESPGGIIVGESFLSSLAISGVWDAADDNVEDSFALVQRYYAPDI